MKNICIGFILIFLGVTAHAKLTPEERYKIVHKDFLDAIHEKMKISSGLLSKRIPGSSSKKDGKGIQSFLENAVSDGTYPESELHAAINPFDSTNIVLSDMRQDPTSLTNPLTFPIYYTKDFGHTWQQSSFSGESPDTTLTRFGGGDPMFVYDLEGKNLYFISIDITVDPLTFSALYGHMWLARSTDGGKTFSTSPTSFLASSELSLTDGTGSIVDKEWMTIDRSNSIYRGTIYGSYLDLDNADTLETLNIARIAPGSANFSTTVTRIPTTGIVTIQIGTLDVDNSGNVHCTFMGSPDNNLFYVYHSVSTDGGMTFSIPNIVSRMELAHRSLTSINTYIPGIDSSRQIPSIQVACGRQGSPYANDIYCIWEALGIATRGNSGEDIYFSHSTDNGSSWSAPITVNQDKPGQKRHQFRPSVFVNDKGIISAAWYDGRGGGNNTSVDYYMSNSFDGGKSFVNETKVSSQPTNFSTIGEQNGSFGIGEYLQILASDYYSIPIWADGRTDDGGLMIMSAFSPIAAEPSGVPERRESITSGLSITAINPNPASDKITITININQDQSVGISLVNMLGEKVLRLAPVLYESGSHTITFPLKNISVGTYILRIETSEGFVDRKVNVIK